MSDQPLRIKERSLIAGLVRHEEGALLYVLGTHDFYTFDPATTLAHDGLNVIRPSNVVALDPGRWLLRKFDLQDLDEEIALDLFQDGDPVKANALELNCLAPLTVADTGPNRGDLGISQATIDDVGVVRLAELGSDNPGLVPQSNDPRLSDAREPLAHDESHEKDGSDEIDVTDLSGVLLNPQRVTVRRNSGVNVGSRPRLNFIEGSNVTLAVADDPGDDEIDITVAASGGGTDRYVATYIIGAGSRATNATLASAIAAHNAGAGPSKIGRAHV